VYNNSGESYTEFVVAASADIALRQVLNYPNPFTTRTEFQFEHNRPGVPLQVRVQIFTASGKLLKTIEQDVLTDALRITGIYWDGTDDFGDRIGRGTYIYRVSVLAPDPSGSGTQTAGAYQKLVILK
jgi:flagellar hook assembly protein FlgD